MGLVIDGADYGVEFDIEVRRESVILFPTGLGDGQFSCVEESSGWSVEVDKAYLKKLVELFGANLDLLD